MDWFPFGNHHCPLYLLCCYGYNANPSSDDDTNVKAFKNVTLHDMDMLPAIDQQDLAKTQEDKKPTMEDMLNLKRRDIPNKVTPHDAGSMNSNDKKTGAPQVSNEPIVMPMVTTTPEPPKIKEEAKKEMEKMTDDNSDKVVERYDDKVSKRILSETPTPPGGWVEFMKWLTKTLQYPAAAKENKLQGTVNITFIINADGTVDDVRIKSGRYLFSTTKYYAFSRQWVSGSQALRRINHAVR